jgi:hypothetical protein
MSDKPDGCVKPSKGPILTTSESSAASPVIERGCLWFKHVLEKLPPILSSVPFSEEDSKALSYQTIKGNGLLSASITAISPLSDRLN